MLSTLASSPLFGVCLLLVGICFVDSKPILLTSEHDDLYSANKAALVKFSLLGRAPDCTTMPVYCTLFGTTCPPGTTCCSPSVCCTPGNACYADGNCYPDVVYTYCAYTTTYATSFITSTSYSTIYTSEEYTSTSWSTTYTTVQGDVATTTSWITVTAPSKRHQPPKTGGYSAPGPGAATVAPTSPPRYEMVDISPELMARRELQGRGDLDERYAYVTITAIYTSLIYSSYYTTAYYTSTINSGTTEILSTYTSTVYSGASSTRTVTSTTTVAADQGGDDGTPTPPPPVPFPDPPRRGLSTGAKAGIGVGSALGALLVFFGIYKCWKECGGGGTGGGGAGGGGAGGGGTGGGGAGGGGAGGGGAGGGGAGGGAGGGFAGDGGAGGAGGGAETTEKSKVNGFEMEEESSESSSLYAPLPLGRNQIRVMVLHKGSFDNPIYCTLKRISLTADPSPDVHLYEALSYVGRQAVGSTYTGRIEGKVYVRTDATSPFVSLPIDSGNLEMALRYLRATQTPPDTDRVLWCDLVCIDQQNESELADQMEFMRAIYSRATRVIAWLGKHDYGLQSLIERTQQIAAIPEVYPIVGMVPQLNSEEPKRVRSEARNWFKSMQTQAHLKRDIDTIANVASLPIWTRRWIIQEVALARDVVLQAGRIEFSWHDLVVLMEMVDAERYHPTDDFYIALSSDGTSNDDEESFRNTIRRGIRPMQLMRSMWHSYGRKDSLRFHLLDLVHRLQNWDCGRPSDRIYSLLGLINDDDLASNTPVGMKDRIALALSVLRINQKSAQIALDIHGKYSVIVKDPSRDPVEEYCTIIEAYSQLVESFAHTYGLLDGLNSSNGSPSSSLPYTPSWMPNINGPKRMFSLIEGLPNNPGNWLVIKRPIFMATGMSRPQLHRQGFYGQDRSEVMTIHGRLFDSLRELTDRPFMPPMCPSVEAATGHLQDWASATSATIDSWGPLSQYRQRFDEAIRFVSVGGLTTRRDDQAPDRATAPELHRHDLGAYPSPGIFYRMSQAFPGPVFRAQCGRRPFLTRKGFLGIGPADIGPDDWICLLDGGQTPYAIRQDGSFGWKFLGECYIHDVMDGETLMWPDERRFPAQEFTFV